VQNNLDCDISAWYSCKCIWHDRGVISCVLDAATEAETCRTPQYKFRLRL